MAELLKTQGVKGTQTSRFVPAYKQQDLTTVIPSHKEDLQSLDQRFAAVDMAAANLIKPVKVLEEDQANLDDVQQSYQNKLDQVAASGQSPFAMQRSIIELGKQYAKDTTFGYIADLQTKYQSYQDLKEDVSKRFSEGNLEEADVFKALNLPRQLYKSQGGTGTYEEYATGQGRKLNLSDAADRLDRHKFANEFVKGFAESNSKRYGFENNLLVIRGDEQITNKEVREALLGNLKSNNRLDAELDTDFFYEHGYNANSLDDIDNDILSTAERYRDAKIEQLKLLRDSQSDASKKSIITDQIKQLSVMGDEEVANIYRQGWKSNKLLELAQPYIDKTSFSKETLQAKFNPFDLKRFSSGLDNEDKSSYTYVQSTVLPLSFSEKKIEDSTGLNNEIHNIDKQLADLNTKDYSAYNRDEAKSQILKTQDSLKKASLNVSRSRLIEAKARAKENTIQEVKNLYNNPNSESAQSKLKSIGSSIRGGEMYKIPDDLMDRVLDLDKMDLVTNPKTRVNISSISPALSKAIADAGYTTNNKGDILSPDGVKVSDVGTMRSLLSDKENFYEEEIENLNPAYQTNVYSIPTKVANTIKSQIQGSPGSFYEINDNKDLIPLDSGDGNITGKDLKEVIGISNIEVSDETGEMMTIYTVKDKDDKPHKLVTPTSGNNFREEIAKSWNLQPGDPAYESFILKSTVPNKASEMITKGSGKAPFTVKSNNPKENIEIKVSSMSGRGENLGDRRLEFGGNVANDSDFKKFFNSNFPSNNITEKDGKIIVTIPDAEFKREAVENIYRVFIYN